MTSKRLTPDQVHAIGIAALDNALNIMEDAAFLLAGGRLRRAFALGMWAVEEAAKVYQCREELRRWSGSLTVAELNERLQPKQAAHAHRYAEILEHMSALAGETVPLPAGFSDALAVAKHDMRARERVLYVEVAPSGHPMTPEGVSEAEIRTWLVPMIDFFATMAGAWRRGLGEELVVAKRAADVPHDDREIPES